MQKFMSSILAVCVLVVGFTVNASADLGVAQGKKSLILVYPEKSHLKNPVEVEFRLENDILIASFDVHVKEINAKPVLGVNEYPFQEDVVEVFLSVSGRSDNIPYYEFELSPYNNTYTVRVDSLKKPFVGSLDMGMEHEATITATGWRAEMAIPLRNLGWDGDINKIVGNAYAILGKKGSRHFWSVFLPKQVKPNFHKPEFFKPLFPQSVAK